MSTTRSALAGKKTLRNGKPMRRPVFDLKQGCRKQVFYRGPLSWFSVVNLRV
jgi:hypothetical protein